MTRKYDLVIASHILEHAREPVELLKHLLTCLNEEGSLLCAVPINERVVHESHEWTVDRDRIEDWAQDANAQIVAYWELDRPTYCLFPVLHARSTLGRVCAQGSSLAVGVLASLLGQYLWFKLDVLLGRLPDIKPAQAVCVLRPL